MFGELFVQRGATRTASLRRHLAEDGVDGQSRSLQQPPQETPPPPPPPTLNGSTSNLQGADSLRIRSILEPKGETFEVTDNRVKAKNAADYTRRMAYLYLYAHECSHRSSALSTDFRAFLRSAKAIDPSGNANRWLAKTLVLCLMGTTGSS